MPLPATVAVFRPVVNVALVARWIVKLVGLVAVRPAQVSISVVAVTLACSLQ